jgi:hypothetical protein
VQDRAHGDVTKGVARVAAGIGGELGVVVAGERLPIAHLGEQLHRCLLARGQDFVDLLVLLHQVRAADAEALRAVQVGAFVVAEVQDLRRVGLQARQQQAPDAGRFRQAPGTRTEYGVDHRFEFGHGREQQLAQLRFRKIGVADDHYLQAGRASPHDQLKHRLEHEAVLDLAGQFGALQLGDLGSLRLGQREAVDLLERDLGTLAGDNVGLARATFGARTQGCGEACRLVFGAFFERKEHVGWCRDPAPQQGIEAVQRKDAGAGKGRWPPVERVRPQYFLHIDYTCMFMISW